VIKEITRDAEDRMHKSFDAFKDHLVKMRTGRANPGLLEHIMVSYYGTDTPLSQVASINVSDARTLMVMPWEDAMIKPIEKAIMTSDLGLNPVTNGKNIRIPLPPLSEERRKEFIRLVRDEAEKARIAVRNIRRDANAHLKDLSKEKEITEDDAHRSEDLIQKMTDDIIAQVDGALKTKETELLEI
jgi:ribosome recycling factor